MKDFEEYRNYALMLLGVSIILLPTIIAPLIVLYVDTSPPEVLSSTPSDGVIYYSVDVFEIYCRDSESGIKRVELDIDGMTYLLTYAEDVTSNVGDIWQKWNLTNPGPSPSAGSHIFSFQVWNNVDRNTTVSGIFEIYTELQGRWYVNGVLITSSAQEIYSPTNVITFKFEKLAGVSDDKITCEVVEDGVSIAGLPLVSPSVWQTSVAIPDGRHVLELRADDGTGSVVMAVLDFTINDVTLPSDVRWVIVGIGIIIAGYGGYAEYQKQKKKRK